MLHNAADYRDPDDVSIVGILAVGYIQAKTIDILDNIDGFLPEAIQKYRW